MRPSRLGLFVLALGVGVAPLAAQSQTAYATGLGAVLDSINGGLLIGERVTVDSTTVSARADSIGHFHLDSVPPGTYRLTVHHPLLDSLGIPIVSDSTVFRARQQSIIVIGTPSRVTLVAQYCPGDTAAHVLIAGRVLDVDTDTPVQNATATVATETVTIIADKDGNGTMDRSAVTHSANTASDGRFYLCLPRGSHPTVTARLGASVTVDVPLNAPTGVTWAWLYVSRADSAKRTSRAGVAGRVQTSDGQPLEGATILVPGTGAKTISRSDGTFQLTGAPGGTRMVAVRRIGFAEWTMPVPLSSTSPRTITAVMQARVTTLAKIDVKARAILIAGAYDRTGFSQRRHTGVGQFLTAEDIARRDVGKTTSLFRGMPGVWVRDTRGGTLVTSNEMVSIDPLPDPGHSHELNGNRTCVAFYVDGVPSPRGLDNDDQGLPRPKDLIGVEVYQSGQPHIGLPPSSCLTIAFWTKAMLNEAGH